MGTCQITSGGAKHPAGHSSPPAEQRLQCQPTQCNASSLLHSGPARSSLFYKHEERRPASHPFRSVLLPSPSPGHRAFRGGEEAFLLSWPQLLNCCDHRLRASCAPLLPLQAGELHSLVGTFSCDCHTGLPSGLTPGKPWHGESTDHWVTGHRRWPPLKYQFQSLRCIPDERPTVTVVTITASWGQRCFRKQEGNERVLCQHDSRLGPSVRDQLVN